MHILLTGAAGFIGYHTAQRLLAQGDSLVGLDDLNSYYDPRIKRARLERLAGHARFRFLEADIADRATMEALFKGERFDSIIHLAAQAGVRYSLENPHVYAETNVTGFLNVLEGARRQRVGHLIYASSSSVYGGNTKVPFSTEDRADSPVSLYAATKRANELMASCYTHLFAIPATGLRFFTVYGPWGRPDMALFRFARAILGGEPLEVYNYGRLWRDFTYVDDAAEAVVRVAAGKSVGHRLFNVGNSRPVGLMECIGTLESALGRRARKRFVPMQPGDVVSTHADTDSLWRATGFRPATPLAVGIKRFARWYRDHFAEGTFEETMHDHGVEASAHAAFRAS